jgi:hypothetical protein
MCSGCGGGGREGILETSNSASPRAETFENPGTELPVHLEGSGQQSDRECGRQMGEFSKGLEVKN